MAQSEPLRVVRFEKNQRLSDLQGVNHKIYGLADDRFYSTWDLLAQQQRFTMRAIKGVRKEDKDKTRLNLLIAMSWSMAIANRLGINIEQEVWKRFPGVCSYCGLAPCACRKIHPAKRKKLQISGTKPASLQAMQEMFESIYPKKLRSTADAAVHLAEEAGEVSEAVHNYLGHHSSRTFREAREEIADYISCVFGLANSSDINMAAELAKTFSNNCHVCHKAPCICSFTSVMRITT